jgi:hypothetical protein
LLVGLLLTCLVGNSAYAAAESTLLSTAHCVPVTPAQATTLAKIFGGGWVHYQPYTVVCAAGPSLSVAAVNIPAADAAGDLFWKAGHRFDRMNDLGPPDPLPAPVILDQAGRSLGRLPAQLFNEPPVSSKILLQHIQNGWPLEISVEIDDPTADTAVKPPFCPPPLIWRALRHRYVRAPGAYFTHCRERGAAATP